MADPLFAAARALFAVATAPGRVPLEVRRRRRAPPLGREERTLHHRRSRHATLPDEFSIQIDVRPDRRAYLEVRRIDHGKRDIALAGRRPDRRGDAADLALAVGGRVQERIVRRLVAGDVQPDEKPAGPRARSARSARRPVKWPFLKSTSHASPSSSGERSRPVRMVCSAETKSTCGHQEPRLDARDVRAPASRSAGCRASGPPP